MLACKLRIIRCSSTKLCESVFLELHQNISLDRTNCLRLQLLQQEKRLTLANIDMENYLSSQLEMKNEDLDLLDLFENAYNISPTLKFVSVEDAGVVVILMSTSRGLIFLV